MNPNQNNLEITTMEASSASLQVFFFLNCIVSFSGLTSVPGDHMGGFQDLLGPSPRARRVPKLDEQMPGEHSHGTGYWQLL